MPLLILIIFDDTTQLQPFTRMIVSRLPPGHVLRKTWSIFRLWISPLYRHTRLVNKDKGQPKCRRIVNAHARHSSIGPSISFTSPQVATRFRLCLPSTLPNWSRVAGRLGSSATDLWSSSPMTLAMMHNCPAWLCLAAKILALLLDPSPCVEVLHGGLAYAISPSVGPPDAPEANPPLQRRRNTIGSLLHPKLVLFTRHCVRGAQD
jgi:hypothetical protein